MPKCEDSPCCGHTPQDPCERQPYDEPGYFERNPLALHEPGSPEYFDALDAMAEED